MAVAKIVVVLSALISIAVSINQADYPSVDVPLGIAVPKFKGDDSSSQESEEDLVDDDPKPCCFPNQWEGNVTSQAGKSGGGRGDDSDNRRGGGGGKFMQSSLKLYVDQQLKKIAGRSTVGCFKNRTVGFVISFHDNSTADGYFFDESAQKCKHKTMNKAQFRPQCIPNNATFEGAFNLGGKDGGLSVQSWSFRGTPKSPTLDRRGGRGRLFFGGKILVQPNDCIPVVVQDHGMFMPGPRPKPGNQISFNQDDDAPGRGGHGKHHGGGGGFVASMYFLNVQKSISDPKAFDQPTYCTSAASTALKYDEELEDEFTDILDRFVDY
jgi:hypothetical protein